MIPLWRLLRARSIIGNDAQIILLSSSCVVRFWTHESVVVSQVKNRALSGFTDAFVTWLLSEIMFISFRKKTIGFAHKTKTAFRFAAVPSVHRSGISGFFRAWRLAVNHFPPSVTQNVWRKTERSLSVRMARFVLDFSRPRVPRPFSNFIAIMKKSF
jgi:hypothetical protein